MRDHILLSQKSILYSITKKNKILDSASNSKPRQIKLLNPTHNLQDNLVLTLHYFDIKFLPSHENINYFYTSLHPVKTLVQNWSTTKNVLFLVTLNTKKNKTKLLCS